MDQGQINVMEEFQFLDAFVRSLRKENGMDMVDVILKVSCKDYLIDEKTKKVLKGKKRATCYYVYVLTFVKENECNDVQCPSCGAKIEQTMSKRCPYCKNTLLLHAKKYTLSSKKILMQERI